MLEVRCLRRAYGESLAVGKLLLHAMAGGGAAVWQEVGLFEESATALLICGSGVGSPFLCAGDPLEQGSGYYLRPPDGARAILEPQANRDLFP